MILFRVFRHNRVILTFYDFCHCTTHQTIKGLSFGTHQVRLGSVSTSPAPLSYGDSFVSFGSSSEVKRVHIQSLSRLHIRTIWHSSHCRGPAAMRGFDSTVPDSWVIELPLQASFSNVDIRFYSFVPPCKRISGSWVILPKGSGSKNPMKCFFFFLFWCGAECDPTPTPTSTSTRHLPPYLLLIILSVQRRTQHTTAVAHITKTTHTNK